MAKKKKDTTIEQLQKINDEAIKREQSRLESAPKLTEIEFWKYYALSFEEVNAEQELQLQTMTLKNLELQTEILKNRMLYIKGNSLPLVRTKFDSAASACNKFIKEIEDRLGIFLKDVEIDKETFEVKKSSSTSLVKPSN